MPNKILVLFCVLLTALPALSYARQPQQFTLADTALAEKYYALSGKFAKANKLDSAIVSCKEATKIYRSIAEKTAIKRIWEKYIIMAYRLGGTQERALNFREALAARQEALKSAVQKFKDNHSLVSRGYNNIGVTYQAMGNYEKALFYFNNAMALNLDSAHVENLYPVYACNNIGTVYLELGDYDKALEYSAKAHKVWIRILGEKHTRVAWQLNNMGNIYRAKRDYQKALTNLEKALSIWREIPKAEVYEIGSAYMNLATVYLNQGKWSNAIQYLDQAQTQYLAMENETNKNEALAMLYQNYALALTEKGDHESALEYHQKALNLALTSFGNTGLGLARIYMEIGNRYREQKRFDLALQHYQKSFFATVNQFNPSDTLGNPSVNEAIWPFEVFNTLQAKGLALRQLAGSQTELNLRKKYMGMALSTYVRSVDFFEYLLRSYKAEGSKLLLSRIAGSVYEKTIEAAADMYKLTKNAADYQLIHIIAARNKAAILTQSLQETNAKHFAGIPDSLLEKERELKVEMAFYQTELLKEKARKQPDSLKLNKLENMFFLFSRNYENLVNRFSKTYSKYHDLKYRTKIPAIEEIQNALGRETALVEYFLGDSSLHIFTITRNDFKITVSSVDSSLRQAIADYSVSFKSLTGQARNKYLQSAVRVYQKLIQPVEQYIAAQPRWVIIPHNELYQIPFEALLRRAPAPQDDDTKLDYLIKHHEISYHYSTALFLKQYQIRGKNSLAPKNRQRAKPLLAQGLVGFAPVFGDGAKNGRLEQRGTEIYADSTYRGENTFRETAEGLELILLPYSQRELQTIVSMFKNKKKMGIGYFHQDAGEEKFKTEAGKFKIVHVSTHGLYNGKYPNLSGLAFSQHQPTPTNDGLLYAAEAYNLELNAELLVLSSCESAGGPLQKGEGLMALTRAFIYAGAENIVASLWKVRDQHTSELMIAFYEEILQGKRYAEALRAAKLQMIANLETAGPQSWAGFILIGK